MDMAVFIGEGTAAAIDFANYVSQLGGIMSPTDILTVLGLGVGASSPFFLLWLGARKVTRMVTTAAKTGKVKV